MVNEVHVRYSGTCEDNKAALKEAFISSIQTLLQAEEVCSSDAECSVTDVKVLCGKRSRRDVSDISRNATDDTSDVTIRFGIRAVVPNKTAAEVTPLDQALVLYGLEDIYFSIDDKIAEGGYSLNVNGAQAEIVEIESQVLPTIESNCTIGEVLVTGENDAVCCKYSTSFLDII